ncbi:MAG: M20/M25/M40 family metallo-hydrolase [Weeksellaceae bacterium]
MDKTKILKELTDFIAIESVSADPARRDEMQTAISFLTKKLESLDFTVKTVVKGEGHPLLIAERKVEGAKKTIGIYGHYDVQPEDPVAEWKSKPFVLTERGDKLYGRGVADDKGHVMQNIAAIEQLIQSDSLTNNIVFILEGEEETGSIYLEQYLQDLRELLQKVDIFFITDVGMYAKGVPQLFYALRGLIYYEIELTIGESDLHSGVYGNRVYNPLNVLSDLFAKMKDIQTGEILIPNFYKDVRVVPDTELKLLENVQKSDDELKSEANVYGLTTVRGVPSYLASKIFPSMDVHGITGGFSGEGPKTVIPRTAKAKFSFRLVDNQVPETVDALVKDFIKNTIPSEIKYTLTELGIDRPFYTSLENPLVQQVSEILSEHFGNNAVINRSGGSIPVAESFTRLFGKPVVLTGFTLSDDNLHAPNENFDTEMFWEGIEALKKIYHKL